MNRKLASAIGMGAATAAAVLAVIAIASGKAYADDITIVDTPFISSLIRERDSGQARTQHPRIANGEELAAAFRERDQERIRHRRENHAKAGQRIQSPFP